STGSASDVLDSYRAAFRTKGSPQFCAAAFVMRMPIAIYPIGLVLIVSARDGRYQFAGVLSACFTAGGCFGHPVLGRLVDRFGQSRVIRPAALAHLASVLVLAILLHGRASDAAVIAPAVVAGLSYVDAGALVRARWSYVLAGSPELTAAFSIESTLDEVIFVIGPLVATLIATSVAPVLVLYLAVALVIVGGAWLARLRGTEPPVHAEPVGGHRSVLRGRGMVLLVVTGAAMGALFSSAEVSMVAFCGQHHHRGASGIVLAALAAGSALAGFVYGARPHRTPLLTRFRNQSVLFAVLPAVLFAAVNIPVLAVCAFVVGLCIAPLLITTFGLIEQLSPTASLTEALTWFTTGIDVGYGGGAALVGGIADSSGARAAFAVAVASALCTGVLGLALQRRLRPVEVALAPS
ncbi:MAG TPA: MFS transporter, partial [Jatrophihabitantaceae bacterium]